MNKRSWVLCVLLFAGEYAFGQVVEDAAARSIPLSVGGSFSFFDAGYASNKVGGIGTYVDWSPFLRGDLGIEGEARWLTVGGTDGFSEYHYLVGPRYRFRAGNRYEPYAKFLVGAGEINFPFDLAHGGYFAFAPGGGAEMVMNDRWRFRADFEYQFWPDAAGIPGIQTAAVRPFGVSVGFTYRLFRQYHEHW